MKKNYKNTDEGKNQELNEPFVNYQTKNRIRVYNSFEEEAEDNYRYLASLTPVEHLANTKRLIDRNYSDKPNVDAKTVKRINFN